MATVTTQRRNASVEPIRKKSRKKKRKERQLHNIKDQMTAEEFLSYYTLLMTIFLLSMIVWIVISAGGAVI